MMAPMPTANFARMVGTTGLLGAELYSEPGQTTGIEWFRSKKPVPYMRALNAMESRVAEIAAGEAGECVWLLEHPALYTAGTSADPSELIDPDRFPVFKTGRGGRFTYHGPGQRVAYVMLNLKARGGDVRAYVQGLQTWLRDTLAAFDIAADPASTDIGVFVEGAKIASIGVRVSRSVTFHGVSLNVAPDLEHFSGIVPCGLKDTPVTSLKVLGVDTDFEKVDAALLDAWPESLRG
ncbi:Octanoyltransferase [Methyloligella halotolerans]|uniref:Octanoyltransferase n=1 Tax=Methyloligella halotolerans TaxID=1177755 RepID=A0A1E2S1Z3_9HYPH|nr:lipoyl(octanoyl) transferase LipB [Methyloligella halotolerans]ODA68345.1 Octanoyltransferase [Methyloligella halotolerans]